MKLPTMGFSDLLNVGLNNRKDVKNTRVLTIGTIQKVYFSSQNMVHKNVMLNRAKIALLPF